MSPKTPVQALKISCADPTLSRTSPVLPNQHNPVGGDLSPKTPVQALKTFLRRPDAFPDKSGPTEPTQPGRRGLVPEDAGASAEDFPALTRRLPGQVRSYRPNTTR